MRGQVQGKMDATAIRPTSTPSITTGISSPGAEDLHRTVVTLRGLEYTSTCRSTRLMIQ